MSNMHVTDKCDEIVMSLDLAPLDKRTGNKVLYGATWIADRDSMLGNRNEDWVRRELRWFVSGSNSLDDLEAPVPKAFQQCAGDNNEVNSAYGSILFDHSMFGDGTCIYTRALHAFLEEGVETRHSVAVITDRDMHRIAYANGKNDFICTNALNLMIDEDGKLHIFAQMRSMDAVWGYRADYSMWDLLMKCLISDLAVHDPTLQVSCGNIIFQVANLHVYPRHHELLERESTDISEMMMRRIWKGLENE